MIRRAYIIGTVALALSLTVAHASPALMALVSSARRWERQVLDIEKTSNSLSPVERVVFGLAAAAADSPSQAQGAAMTPRTR